MELIVMILAPLPLGYLVRRRLVAYLTYIAMHSFVFTYQTAALVIEWVGGSTAAFGPFPAADSEAVWGYGAVNLVIYGAGLGLVSVGHRLGSRRRSPVRPVSLDPVT